MPLDSSRHSSSHCIGTSSALERIRASAFFNTNTESLVIPDTVLNWVTPAVFGVLRIDSVAIPDGVIELGDPRRAATLGLSLESGTFTTMHGFYNHTFAASVERDIVLSIPFVPPERAIQPRIIIQRHERAIVQLSSLILLLDPHIKARHEQHTGVPEV